MPFPAGSRTAAPAGPGPPSADLSAPSCRGAHPRGPASWPCGWSFPACRRGGWGRRTPPPPRRRRGRRPPADSPAGGRLPAHSLSRQRGGGLMDSSAAHTQLLRQLLAGDAFALSGGERRQKCLFCGRGHRVFSFVRFDKAILPHFQYFSHDFADFGPAGSYR